MIICNSDFLFTVHATAACPGVEVGRCCRGGCCGGGGSPDFVHKVNNARGCIAVLLRTQTYNNNNLYTHSVVTGGRTDRGVGVVRRRITIHYTI